MSIFIGNSDIIKYILSQTEDNLEIIGDDKNINIIDIRDKAISFNSERYIIDLLSLDNKEEEIVKKYNLNLTQNDKAALENAINSCTA